MIGIVAFYEDSEKKGGTPLDDSRNQRSINIKPCYGQQMCITPRWDGGRASFFCEDKSEEILAATRFVCFSILSMLP
jgi:hypothetical protein